MSQPGDLLSQAGGFLRAAPEPGWDAIAARVIAAVRATPRPGGWPLIADGPDHPGQGHLYISENVIRSTLAVTLRQLYLCAPTAIEFGLDDGTLRSVHIEVIGSYGTELRRLADRIRATTSRHRHRTARRYRHHPRPDRHHHHRRRHRRPATHLTVVGARGCSRSPGIVAELPPETNSPNCRRVEADSMSERTRKLSPCLFVIGGCVTSRPSCLRRLGHTSSPLRGPPIGSSGGTRPQSRRGHCQVGVWCGRSG